MSQADVELRVRKVIAESLCVDLEEVKKEAKLIGDLGAESIDFLDIVFRLEKNFDIKIPRGELFPENIASADSGFVVGGKVTESGIAELRNRMPHANLDKFAADPKVERISDLFTVDMVCKFLAHKLGA